MKVAVLLALAAGCSSAPAATADFFGPTIEPPRGLTWIRPGMTVEEAKRLVPGLHERAPKGVRDELVIDSGVSDVTLTVRIDAGLVQSVIAIVQGHTAREMLERAWGKPQLIKDSLGQPEVTWVSEATGWKVKLDCLGRNCNVEYLPYHVLTAAFFGAHVVPPGDLGKLKIGMKLADAKALAPGPVQLPQGIATEIDGVHEYVRLDDKLGTVRQIYLNLPDQADKVIALAWGEAAQATEPVGKRVSVWHDPETGWQATLRHGMGVSYDLWFDNYVPAEKLFGDQPDRLDALTEPVLGRTVDEVKKAYTDQVIVQGKEVSLALPPTEWEQLPTTRVALTVGGGGHVRELSFSVPFKRHPEARETLLDLFKKKWGEPKQIEDDGKPVLVFREESPRVEIHEDTAHGAWRIDVR